ncbi:MAG TPA: amidohydrolase family protein [Vicinamibacterales bacterium]|jgi:predicted TIM-barrel fold metal-dependent hydrolase|nr:amidohydrolase family protein [Vicinamibacterales bacterium]
MLKVDVFNHIFPKPFFQRLEQVAVNKGAIKRFLHIPYLHELDVRFRMIDEFGGQYRQIVSLSAPPIETINPDPQITIDLARLANDSQAEVVRAHPDRFPGFIASLPLNQPEASVTELERAVTELGALGVQVFSNVNGLPLDDGRFTALFETANRLHCPILLHPARGAGFPDYPGEPKSKYEIWWTFGWPFETSAAMQRLVFSRLFDRLPDIKIVTHHLGAMIPYFEGRIGPGLDQFGSRTADEDYEGLRKSLPKRPFDYFKMFWADTAVFGSRAATECGLKFFGFDQVVFASDAPFDPEGGSMYIRETIKILDTLEISDTNRRKLYQENAERLFNRRFS